MLSDVSACSFCVGDDESLITVSEYVQYVQPAEARMSFSVGGASVERDVHMGAFTARAVAPDTAPPPPRTGPEPEYGSEDGSSICLPPPHPSMPQDVPHNFAGIIAGSGLSVRLTDPAPLLLSCMQDTHADTVSVADDDCSESYGDWR
ncbi:hypothetical protein CYMTET_34405 [Cymbomonas tetramitiformis]|uniref:Uncharacterized protein n=1 Tax=Cymbomonas tetramitiformis TaxID=36881 RepID=A0AAE0KQ79_9CHLO|nr:hypothetical protein CYMTET_34405 [Cymbomonas tetramitiformis]